MKDFDCQIECYDIERKASVYGDNVGERWWTKAWFNGREKGEKSIEITRQLSVAFIHGEITLDAWLSRFYPEQMKVYRDCINETRRMLVGV